MKKRHFSHFLRLTFLLSIACFFSSCGENISIVNDVDEREANEIVVFLASKGIESQKVKAEEAAAGGGAPQNLWNIYVDKDQSVDAMSMLNHTGLPRRKGVTLLDLFAKEGLMTSDREERVRYQAGLEEELKNTIRKIDGVLDAEVQISFPSTEGIAALGAPTPKIKASVYVKHQGILDDPNNHLESKIKRLLASSVDGLDFEHVSVISDRSRLTDIFLDTQETLVSPEGREKEYVNIWDIIMTRNSAARFRTIFFLLLGFILLFIGIIGWLIFKFYPFMRKEKKSPPEGKT